MPISRDNNPTVDDAFFSPGVEDAVRRLRFPVPRRRHVP
jgi:hypothetical protein